MAQAPQFRVDPVTGEVQEAVYQAVSDASSFDAALEAAQNSVNAATETVSQLEASYAAQVQAVEASSLALEDARKAKEAAEEELQFQTDRKTALDEALQLRDQLAQSSPESEFAETDSESADYTGAPGEAVDIPVVVA